MRDRFANSTYSIQQVCDVFHCTRQVYYRYRVKKDKEARIAQIVVSMVKQERKLMPREGGVKLYKRLKESLKEKSIKIGRDKFYKILRGNGLLVKRKKKYVRTTDSRHRFYKYKNLIKDYRPSRPNEIWVSDITYIRVGKGFMYLDLITDAYSRKIVGYDISASLGLNGCLRALKMALQQRKNPLPLIHHSDRGFQYCSPAYTKMLHKRNIQISMAGKGNCYENALAERVNGILKLEFLLDYHFENQNQARKAVRQAIHLYNTMRLHMSIDYQTPDQKHAA